ncbi:MAG: cytochrome b/b6 domain-containing protein [Wenzhouxiangellaceae bacterium]|nr:cytochrome b/b6 domain-containing protein [Wenzhouxiangellaceae bacterium]
MSEEQAGRLVWDWPLRLWHWLFAMAVAGAWITGEWGGFDWRQWHLWFGQAAIGLLIFRLIWGFVGTRHARFASFLPRPSQLLAYLKTIARRDAPASVGHNPPGALAVLAMLLFVAVQAGSGLFISDDIFYEGPWFAAVSSDTTELAGRIHHRLATPIGILLGLHLAAIAAYRLFKAQRLTRAMITGRKPAEQVPESAAIGNSRSALALILIVLVAALTWWLLTVAPPEPAVDLVW